MWARAGSMCSWQQRGRLVLHETRMSSAFIPLIIASQPSLCCLRTPHQTLQRARANRRQLVPWSASTPAWSQAAQHIKRPTQGMCRSTYCVHVTYSQAQTTYGGACCSSSSALSNPSMACCTSAAAVSAAAASHSTAPWGLKASKAARTCSRQRRTWQPCRRLAWSRKSGGHAAAPCAVPLL